MLLVVVFIVFDCVTGSKVGYAYGCRHLPSDGIVAIGGMRASVRGYGDSGQGPAPLRRHHRQRLRHQAQARPRLRTQALASRECPDGPVLAMPLSRLEACALRYSVTRMADKGVLLFAVIHVYDCVTKSKLGIVYGCRLDSAFGCGHSLPDGIVMIGGMRALVNGFEVGGYGRAPLPRHLSSIASSSPSPTVSSVQALLFAASNVNDCVAKSEFFSLSL